MTAQVTKQVKRILDIIVMTFHQAEHENSTIEHCERERMSNKSFDVTEFMVMDGLKIEMIFLKNQNPITHKFLKSLIRELEPLRY